MRLGYDIGLTHAESSDKLACEQNKKSKKRKTQMKKKQRTRRYNSCGEHPMIKTMIVSNIKSEEEKKRDTEKG